MSTNALEAAHLDNLLNSPKVDIPNAAWQPTGNEDDPRARLLASVQMCGVRCYLEAWAVRPVDDGDGEYQRCDYDDEEFATLYGILAGADAGELQTTTIEGREYVLFACSAAS